jgi:hypothetical protein
MLVRKIASQFGGLTVLFPFNLNCSVFIFLVGTGDFVRLVINIDGDYALILLCSFMYLL